MGRSPCCEKIGLNRGKWSAEEDDKLVKYIKANGEGSWRSLPKNAGLLRCGKSCRLRWINYLRADVKRGNFTQHEEETIVKLHKTLGNKWSLIARHLPGRTDNEIKNYWNSHLSRTIYRYRFIGEAPADMIETTTKKKLGPTSGKKNAADAVLVGVGLEPSGRNDEGKLSDTSSPKDAFMLSPDDAQGMEMDDDILMHLNYFLQDGPTDQSHNGLMEMDSGGGSSSDLDLYACLSPVVSYFTDDVLQCLSPVVSYFTDDVLQWDHNGAGGELDLWTEGDDILIWS